MRSGPHAAALLALLPAVAAAACTPVPAPDEGAGIRAASGHGDAAADRPRDPATGPAPLHPGERPPNIALRDSTGRELSLATFRNHAVVLTFFETRSVDPDLCRELLARMERLQDAVPENLWTRLHLLSVSVDPAWDTPSRLAAEGRRRGADPARWTLATADEADLERFAAAFQVARWRRDDGSVGHTLTTAILDGEGRLAARFAGTASWNDAELLAAAVSAARR